MLNKAAAALTISVGLSSPSLAANQCNANSVHRVTEVLTYTYDTTILFRVDNMPSIAGCRGDLLVIPGDASMDTRHQILSRLLLAYSTKETVNIGYDGITCGPVGYVLVYRVG